MSTRQLSLKAESCRVSCRHVEAGDTRSRARRRGSAARRRCGLARDGASVGDLRAAHRAARRSRRAKSRRAAAGALPIVADVTREDEMSALVARTVEQLRHARRDDVQRRVPGLRARSTTSRPSRCANWSTSTTWAPTTAIRAALPIFRRQKRGPLVIVVSSIVGKRGVPDMGALFRTTKFAQVGLAECLRAELSGTQHSRHCRVPGVAPTPNSSSVMTRETGVTVTRSGGPRQEVQLVAERASRARSSGRCRRSSLISRRAPWCGPTPVAPGFCDRIVQPLRTQADSACPDG